MSPQPEDGEKAAADPRPASMESLSTPEGLELAKAIARAARQSVRAVPRKQNPSPRGFGRGGGRGQGRLSGAHPDDRDPQTLSASLGRLVAERGWDTEVSVHSLFARWPQIVGADVARHAQPERFSAGTLTVRTDSTAWATQLRLLAPTVLRKLNAELPAPGRSPEGGPEQAPGRAVERLKVVGPDAPSWSKGRRTVRGGRGPRDTYG